MRFIPFYPVHLVLAYIVKLTLFHFVWTSIQYILIVASYVMQASETKLCCICFEQVCTIEVQDCGHQMCAQCTLALCCHNKPNPTTASLTPPVCPFCRSTIARLVVVETESPDETDRDSGDINSPKLSKSRKARNLNEGSGSSSLKGLSSFGKMGGRSSGRIAADIDWVDKQWLLKFFSHLCQLMVHVEINNSRLARRYGS